MSKLLTILTGIFFLSALLLFCCGEWEFLYPLTLLVAVNALSKRPEFDEISKAMFD